MDPQAFDRVSRLVATSGSRRTAWRVLLGAALLGATTRGVMATPRCDNDRTPTCGKEEEEECCPGKCVTHDCGHQRCCTAEHNLIICGNTCCKTEDERGGAITDPCSNCVKPVPPPPSPEDPACQSGITGSYRRR